MKPHSNEINEASQKKKKRKKERQYKEGQLICITHQVISDVSYSSTYIEMKNFFYVYNIHLKSD